MKPLKQSVSITLDADLVEKIKELAAYQDRSFSQYINRVLRRHADEVAKRADARETPPEH